MAAAGEGEHEEFDEGEDELEPEARAEIEARRRVALAQIRQYPDAVLRMRANEVDRFDENLARLADRMTGLMHDARGVGLAATQVGVLQRLFVFQPGDEEEATAVVNPEIVSRSGETGLGDEGCLSLQGVNVPVERSLEITLAGVDLQGKPIRLELQELAARVAQHELDHLDGTLIIERTDSDSRRDALATLRQRPAL
ncbi:MAG TPA: peptide deformylase [Gaiellaceae bacterium]|nr:peptide deformylase [Gaiellaceae bacterium]